MPKLLLHQALGLERPALAAAVGGGGKTTLLFALAAETAQSAEHGMTIVTTTTKMTLPPESKQLPLIVGADEASRAAALDDVQRRGLSAAVVGAGRGDRGRILGVQPDWPARALRAPGVGLVAVEADGSAGRPFKAPAEHEPVIPDGVDLVIAVVGAQVLGQPLDERRAHRPERVRALLGIEPDDCCEITPEIVATVLAHPQGGRKDVPADAQYAVVIANTTNRERAAQSIAAACHAAAIERIIAYDNQAEVVRIL